MKIEYPSSEFDEAIAAVCHGLASEEQVRALNLLLRSDSQARDEYLLRIELHSRLASDFDLFVSPAKMAASHDEFTSTESAPLRRFRGVSVKRKVIWAAALAACLAFFAAGGWRLRVVPPAREPAPEPKMVDAGNDWKPSTANLPGQEYPRINSEGRAQFRIKDPAAKQVSVSIANNIGRPYVSNRNAEGEWTVTTAPLGIGFHFYRLNIDGRNLADPATEVFRGGGGDGRSSGIEVPTGEDFHEVQNVPHGETREHRYLSQTTGETRRIFVYTPPGYEQNPAARYPVLYLLPGAGEDESCWPAQGRANQILDNMIGAQKARPMIVVMEGGIARRPDEPETASRPPAEWDGRYLALDEVFVNDLIPMIDRTFRTVTDASHRALAGLSLGGMQAFAIGLRHPELFTSLGGFSGVGISPPGKTFDPQAVYGGVMADRDAFNRKVRVLFFSAGVEEPEWLLEASKQAHDALQAAGIHHVFYESPDTAHEWHTWRRSLREFASLLFKN